LVGSTSAVRTLFGHASFSSRSLRQCEWDCANGDEQNQVKRTSDEMRFGSGVNLLLQWGFVLVGDLILELAKLSLQLRHAFSHAR
jgi:hypothetical protein